MENKHIVAITGIIIKDGKYLITRRNLQKKAFPGKWTVPGGRLEAGDYINSKKDTSEHWYNILEKVLRREIREEAGLEIKNIKYLTSMTFMRGDEPTLIISLYADYEGGEVQLNEESVDYKWVLLEEAKEYDLIEGIYEELEMLDRILKGEGVVEWKKEESIFEKVRTFVENECKKPTSKYGYDVYLHHFVQVHDYAKELAEKIGANIEIVELAAWLHDIGSIIYGRENHHITSCEIAEKKLKEFGYPIDKIEKIKQCIYSHRGSTNIERGTREAQIIADADAMSAFDNIGGQFKATFIYDNMTQEESRKYVAQKLINSYSKLSSEAKKLIKPKFDAAMLLLGKNVKNGPMCFL